MQNRLWLGAAAILILGVLGAARAVPTDTLGETRKALQANYNDRDGAVARKDADGAVAHYAPDFVGLSLTGKTHGLAEERADFVKTFTTLAPRSNITKTTITRLALTKSGAAASVMRHGVLVLVNKQTGGSDVLILDGSYQDTWARRGGVWTLTREQATALKATMNGRPL